MNTISKIAIILISCLLLSCSKDDRPTFTGFQNASYQGKLTVKDSKSNVYFEEIVVLRFIDNTRYGYWLQNNPEGDYPYKSGTYKVEGNTINFMPDYHPGMEVLMPRPEFISGKYNFQIVSYVLELKKEQKYYPESSEYKLEGMYMHK